MGYYKSRRSKTDNIKAHARRRLQERTNLPISSLKKIAMLIQLGQSTFIEKQSNSRTIHRVTLDKTTIDVAYDTKRKLVVTVLIPNEISLDLSA